MEMLPSQWVIDFSWAAQFYRELFKILCKNIYLFLRSVTLMSCDVATFVLLIAITLDKH